MSSTLQPKDGPHPAAGQTQALVGVRYSLPQMLAELRLERVSGSFATEKLDQAEIGKLVKSKSRSRAKSKA